jgi:hypothetical protein
MTDEIISRNIDEIGHFWTKTVYPYAAPIFEANSRLEPDPIGSAVRVAFAARQYLVTAAHVIAGHLEAAGKESSKGAPYAYIPEQVEIEGQVRITPDPIDLAIIPLLCPTSRPGLPLPQYLALEVKERERCLFVGFQARPKSWNIDSSRLTVRPTPLSYMGTVLKPSAQRFSIRFNEKHLYRSGRRHNAVGKLNGISGAGVFVLRQDSPRLAGIVIEYHKSASEIIATTSLALWYMFNPHFLSPRSQQAPK